MEPKLMTPGVYLVENNAFPSSAVAVETAIPVFIGYTSTAAWKGKDLKKVPTRITSFAEYKERFGEGFSAKFDVSEIEEAETTDETKAGANTETTPNTPPKVVSTIGGKKLTVSIAAQNTAYMYNSIRLFYANGGGPCYILSVGLYEDTKVDIKPDDFGEDVFKLLEKEYEPTLIVIPDAISLGRPCYKIYVNVLAHCAKMQSRFGIFDLVQFTPTSQLSTVAEDFRYDIGTQNLNYGAAYYPWLKTSIVNASEITFQNLTSPGILSTLLSEDDAQQVLKNFESKYTPGLTAEATPVSTSAAKPKDKTKETTPPAGEAAPEKKPATKSDLLNFHQALLATSPTYNQLLDEIRGRLNELPSSAAMAGLYTVIDNSRGVWKSPANISVNMVNAPAVNISHDEQEKLNVDVIAGKSINAIRSFPGIGTLVWGGRTLDGNSQDWRYINVRRTMIMIEQSLKLATRAYVFEPNDANTWITVKSMMNNFLLNLWKQGALAGSAPEQAFDVQVGLGSTMTPNDILDGKMLIMVKVAIVRPAEFIVITFQQQMQQS
ncbi:MAG: phage tail sheath family protein [Flavobacteriales bacterium]